MVGSRAVQQSNISCGGYLGSVEMEGWFCVSQLVQLLLDHGAHLDQPNRAGDCPAIFVAVNPLNNVHLVNYVTLRCLAATAVCKYKIPYQGQIPATLETFVKFHEE
jgi:hypothetical protein